MRQRDGENHTVREKGKGKETDRQIEGQAEEQQ